MSLYVIINLLVIAFPLLLSFDKKVAFYKRYLPLFLAMILVSGIYIGWDIWATHRGDWWFSPEHTGSFRFQGLPLGEILFFITVPYACIFVYECARAYIKPAQWKVSAWILLSTGAAILALGLLFHDQDYTLTVSIAFFITMLLSAFPFKSLFNQNHTWIYLLITLFLFLLVNSFLAGIPIVNYGEKAFFGYRFITIPLEDFAYNISYLLLMLMAYVSFKKLLKQDV